MKTKIISFIFLMAFILTAVHCSPDSNESPDTPDKPTLLEELQGQYQSEDGIMKLTFNTNKYTLYLGDQEGPEGDYRINESGTIELYSDNEQVLINEQPAIFKRERDQNGQIVRLIHTSSGLVLHRVIEKDENEKKKEKEELQGQYQTEDGIKLTLNTNKFTLSDNLEKLEGEYRINESGTIELYSDNEQVLINEQPAIFKIERDQNGQIVRLIHTSSELVLHRVI